MAKKNARKKGERKGRVKEVSKPKKQHAKPKRSAARKAWGEPRADANQDGRAVWVAIGPDGNIVTVGNRDEALKAAKNAAPRVIVDPASPDDRESATTRPEKDGHGGAATRKREREVVLDPERILSMTFPKGVEDGLCSYFEDDRGFKSAAVGVKLTDVESGFLEPGTESVCYWFTDCDELVAFAAGPGRETLELGLEDLEFDVPDEDKREAGVRALCNAARAEGWGLQKLGEHLTPGDCYELTWIRWWRPPKVTRRSPATKAKRVERSPAPKKTKKSSKTISAKKLAGKASAPGRKDSRDG